MLPSTLFSSSRSLAATRRLRAAGAVLSLGLVAALASSCGAYEEFPPACPNLSLLKEGADLTRFRPGGSDLTDMVTDARITAVPAKCSTDAKNPGKVRATLQVTMDIARGPAATGRAVTLTYFVAVTEGERVLDEQDYPLQAGFPSNIDRVSVTGNEIDLLLPVTPKKSAAAYTVYVGLRLTPEELAFNRKKGVR